jgi:hypothetical protein
MARLFVVSPFFLFAVLSSLSGVVAAVYLAVRLNARR